MVLEDPETKLVAIEANVGAARTLCDRPYIKASIREGRLGDSAFPSGA